MSKIITLSFELDDDVKEMHFLEAITIHVYRSYPTEPNHAYPEERILKIMDAVIDVDYVGVRNVGESSKDC